MRNWLRLFVVLCSTTTREFFRDKVAAFFSFFFPLMFVVIFGVTQGQRHAIVYHLGLLDRDGSHQSAQLIARLSSNGALQVTVLTAQAQPHDLGQAHLDALLVIPAHGFSSQGAPPLQIVVDPRNSTLVGFLKTALNAAVAETLARVTGREAVFRYTIMAPAVKPLTDFTYILPGLLAMALLQLGLFATATPLIAARERGTLRHLALTPMPRSALFAAQLVLRMATGVVQISLLLGVGAALFHLSIAGHWPTLIALSLLGATMFVAIGYVIAGLVPSQAAGMPIVLLVNFAMLFLGGIFFDTSTIEWLSWVGKALPVTYLADAFRHLITGTSSRFPIWVSAAVMAGWTLLAAATAVRTFRFDMRRA